MFFIMGIDSKQKQLNYNKVFICEECRDNPIKHKNVAVSAIL